MEILRLNSHPELLDKTVELIEASFNYPKGQSFKSDFAPLVDQSNLENCFVLKEGEKVIAHVGHTKRSLVLNNKVYNIALIGGVSVALDYRKQGISRKLLEHVLNHLSRDYAFVLLWSNQIEYYQKFGFYPCIAQFEYQKSGAKAQGWIKTKISDLTETELQELSGLYSNINELRVHRTLEDWKDLTNIDKADLHIKKDQGKITSYFIMNKGGDLQNVVHETGGEFLLADYQSFGKVWSTVQVPAKNPTSLYGSLMKIGDHKQFTEFVDSLTVGSIEIQEIQEDIVKFYFIDTLISENMSDFLTGVFGPNRYEELNHIKSLFISGMDSV